MVEWGLNAWLKEVKVSSGMITITRIKEHVRVWWILSIPTPLGLRYIGGLAPRTLDSPTEILSHLSKPYTFDTLKTVRSANSTNLSSKGLMNLPPPSKKVVHVTVASAVT